MIFHLQQNNTALHYAALSGLKSCVEVLVNHSCPLFVENKENHTPCDCAESNGYSEIALYLESKMVFSVSLSFSFHCHLFNKDTSYYNSYSPIFHCLCFFHALHKIKQVVYLKNK